MTLEQFYIYKEKAFDAFCKTIIRNESTDAYRELADLATREVTLSALSHADLAELCAEDVYHPYSITFPVCGSEVTIYDWTLGQALHFLPPNRRNVILMFYGLGLSDPQIGRLLHLSTSAVNYRRTTALARLKEIMEGLENGN